LLTQIHQSQPTSSDSAVTPTVPSLPQPKFDQFYKHAELTTLLQAFAEARPDLLELRELGRSHEGRPIWFVVITRRSTGIDEDKPAFWVDGNIHAAELTASTSLSL
jgi:hypothetical protein